LNEIVAPVKSSACGSVASTLKASEVAVQVGVTTSAPFTIAWVAVPVGVAQLGEVLQKEIVLSSVKVPSKVAALELLAWLELSGLELEAGVDDASGADEAGVDDASGADEAGVDDAGSEEAGVDDAATDAGVDDAATDAGVELGATEVGVGFLSPSLPPQAVRDAANTIINGIFLSIAKLLDNVTAGIIAT